MPPAARITDAVVHLPPVLTGGPPALTVLIGYLPAWKGIPLAAAPGLMTAQLASEAAIKVAENIALVAAAAAVAAAGTPGAPAAVTAATAARVAAEAVKTVNAATMSATIAVAAAGGASIHACTTPWPLPPHGPGVVISGSATVSIENSPACRMGDTIVEAIGPPNKIVMGCMTVMIGDTGMGGSQGAALSAAAASGAALCEA
ncbi:MAG: PAAR domain-containing protein [Thermoanaerobaculia bacterium]|nr:PAAR domain-containing protein [Thermoanaerobaculia bacterium]